MVIAHHDLGPVYHGRHDKAQLMAAQLQHVAFLDDMKSAVKIHAAEELAQHLVHLGIADDFNIGIVNQKSLYSIGVVRLKMGDHQIIQLSSVECVCNIFKECLVDSLIHRVKKRGLFIQHQIGVVGHPIGNPVNPLKASQTAVISTYPNKIFLYLSCALHLFLPPFNKSIIITDFILLVFLYIFCGICNSIVIKFFL